jgi:putative addiction module killer protein
LYFVQHGQTMIVMLAGGDKTTQSADIALALRLARQLKEES